MGPRSYDVIILTTTRHWNRGVEVIIIIIIFVDGVVVIVFVIIVIVVDIFIVVVSVFGGKWHRFDLQVLVKRLLVQGVHCPLACVVVDNVVAYGDRKVGRSCSSSGRSCSSSGSSISCCIGSIIGIGNTCGSDISSSCGICSN